VLTSGSIAGRVGLVVVGSILVRQIDPGARVVMMMMIYLKNRRQVVRDRDIRAAAAAAAAADGLFDWSEDETWCVHTFNINREIR
jgi:hypothetical protein